MRSSAEGFRMVKELCSNIQDLYIYITAKQGRLEPDTPWAPSGPVRIASRIPPGLEKKGVKKGPKQNKCLDVPGPAECVRAIRTGPEGAPGVLDSS